MPSREAQMFLQDIVVSGPVASFYAVPWGAGTILRREAHRQIGESMVC